MKKMYLMLFSILLIGACTHEKKYTQAEVDAIVKAKVDSAIDATITEMNEIPDPSDSALNSSGTFFHSKQRDMELPPDMFAGQKTQ